MKTLEIDAIRREPESFIRQLESGEGFVVVDHTKPVAEVHPVLMTERRRRPCGLYAGRMEVPDDFDDPLPDEILRDFGEL